MSCWHGSAGMKWRIPSQELLSSNQNLSPFPLTPSSSPVRHGLSDPRPGPAVVSRATATRRRNVLAPPSSSCSGGSRPLHSCPGRSLSRAPGSSGSSCIGSIRPLLVLSGKRIPERSQSVLVRTVCGPMVLFADPALYDSLSLLLDDV